MKKLCIIGGSGHAKVIVDIVESMNKAGVDVEIIGFVDDDCKKETLLGYKRLGPIQLIDSLSSDRDVFFIIGIGSNQVRSQLSAQYQLSWFTAIHPLAIVSRFTNIGFGTVIMPGAIINSGAKVGNHVIINTGSIIEHDCFISDNVHISPNATLCGNVYVGSGTHVGAGATVIQNKKIGSFSTIGAGAVVVKDIPDNVTVKGIPAK